MLTAERRQAILSRLERDGKVVASELVDALGVSEDTVRRDLRELAAGGLVQRVHGGALPPPPRRGELRPAAAASRPRPRRISPRRRCRCSRAASVMLLDGGTTALELARRLPPERDCTVLTNSPPGRRRARRAPARRGRADRRAAAQGLPGDGRLRDRRRAAPGARRRVRARHLQPAPGARRHHADHDEAHVKRAMVEASAEVIALATADKLRTASPWLVAPLADVTHLVTDAGED